MQAKLLRALQQMEIVRIGDTKPTPVDVRIIAATNEDLKDAVAQGTFRGDLYFRLNVIEIAIPPLRERKADIGYLAGIFLDRLQSGQRAGRAGDFRPGAQGHAGLCVARQHPRAGERL